MSWAAGKVLADRVGKSRIVLLFADTKMEDEDLYRFLEDASKNIGSPLVKIADGRTPWDVFFDERYLGNSRIDPCSKILKRQLLRKWMDENYSPGNAVISVGYHASEKERLEKVQKRYLPWKVIAPLCEPPLIAAADVFKMAAEQNLKVPRLYDLGFSHNNCGGFCVKAGQVHFQKLLSKLPERYAYHEQKEQELREFLGKDVAIMRDRSGGTVRPLTMKEFRERQNRGCLFDQEDSNDGCNCFAGEE